MRTLMDRTTVFATVFAVFALATAAPAAAQEKEPDAVVPLSRGDGDPVHGQALIWDADETGDMDAHGVEVRLDGRQSGSTYVVHLHREACSGDGAFLLGVDGAGEDPRSARASEGTDSATTEVGKKTSGETAGTDGRSDPAHEARFARAELPGGTPAACRDVSEKTTRQAGKGKERGQGAS